MDALKMTLGKFYKSESDNPHNLYIVWRGKTCLYIGISRAGVWARWFGDLSPHILINAGGFWRSDYSSTIGRVIVKNRPASLRWVIELRHIDPLLLAETEQDLIYDMRPLFNVMGAPRMTPSEQKLANVLQYGEAVHIANAGSARLKT